MYDFVDETAKEWIANDDFLEELPNKELYQLKKELEPFFRMAWKNHGANYDDELAKLLERVKHR
eukprot:UN05930